VKLIIQIPRYDEGAPSSRWCATFPARFLALMRLNRKILGGSIMGKLTLMSPLKTNHLWLSLALALMLALGLLWLLNGCSTAASGSRTIPATSQAPTAEQATQATVGATSGGYVILGTDEYGLSNTLEWKHVMGSPVPNRLFAVTTVSDTLGWAIGDEGTILCYNGSNWEAISSPTPYRLYDLAMMDTDTGWAVGDYGTVLHLTEAEWALWPQQLPGANLHAIAMASPDTGWAVGRAGTILTYDGGRWDVADSPTTFPLYGVATVSPTLAFAVGAGGTILAYRGDVWTVEPTPTGATLNAVAMSGPSEGWAVGNGGAILHYDGAVWTTVVSPVSDSLHALLIVASDDVWASGQAGLLIHYDGSTWSQVTSPATHSLYGLAHAPGDDLWAVGFAATILRYSTGQWNPVTRLTPAALRDLLWDGTVGWAAGDDGEILYNGGGGWTQASSPTTATLYAMGQITPGDLWAVGERGTILHNDGPGWMVITSPTTLTLRGLTFTAPSEGWAVGGEQHPSAAWSAGLILHYDGLAWQAEPISPEEPLHALAFASPDAGWAVGDGGDIWRYDAGDWSADSSPTQRSLWAIAVISPTEAWAVGEAGVILHYDGDAWIQIHSPTANGLHKVIMTSPDEGWALGDSGAILHYDGRDWRVIPSPTAYRLLGGALDGSGDLWAVGNGGTLLHRPLTSGDFRLAVSPQHAFVISGTTTWVTLTISAIDGFSAPLTVSVSALTGLSPTWSTITLMPSTEISLGLTTAPTPSVGTLSPTITANGDGLTHTIGLSLTVTPGEWLPGTSLRSGGRLHALAYDGAGQTWAVGDDGLIWRYDRIEWYQYAPHTSNDLYAVDALSPTLIWAAGEQGALLHFDGVAWLNASSPTTMPLFSLALIAPDDGWAVGGGGTILRYDGLDWQKVSTPGHDWLYDVDMAADGTGWAVGWGGAIWRYDGATWQVVDSPTSHWLRAVSVIGPEEAWAVGSEGTILHYTSGQWHLFPSPTPARLLDVHFDGPDDGWAVGGDGTVLRYDGSGWHALPQPALADLRALNWAGSDYGLAVGNGGSVACYRAADAGIPVLPGCGGEPISQTSELPHQVFFPEIGRDPWEGGPIDLFGVQTMGGAFSRDPAIVYQMAEAGIRWARLPFSWKLIEPANTTPDQFHWSVYDDWLELLSTAGIQPQPFFARNPSWAGVLPASYIDQSDVAEQQAFVTAAVARYSQPPYSVSHWEMYNEPDNGSLRPAERGWGMWGYDGAGYADQLATLHPAVKEANPSAQVLLGGVAYDSFVEEGGSFVRSFITDVLTAGGGAYFDLMNFHYYGPDLTGRIQHFENMLTTFSLDKPIVCTEVSKSLGDPDLEDEGELYARYLPQVMMRGLAEGLPIVNWFALADMESTWRPGLFALDRTTRPAYRAYQVLTEVLCNARYVRLLSSEEMNGAPLEGYVFDVPDGSGRLDVVWTTEEVVMDWQVPSPGVYLTNKYGETRYVYDSDDGRSDGLTTFQVGVNPLYALYVQQAAPPLRQSLAASIWPPKEIPAQISRTQDIGIVWTRVNVYWDKIEPVKTTPRTYDWQVTDSRILGVTLAGIKPIVLLGANPSWAATHYGGPVTDTQDILDFLAAAAERYDGDGFLDAPGSPVVQVWEFYNEPDNQDPNSMKYRGYGAWGGRGEEYAQFLAQARAALRSTNPTAQVALGGLAHEDVGQDAFDMAFPGDIFGYIRDHPGDYFDFFNFHFFPWFGKNYSDWGPDIIGKTAYFRAWMDQYGVAWPIIVTEAAHCSESVLGPPWTGNYEDHARYVPQLYSRSAAADIKVTVWLLLFDLSIPNNCRYGLNESDGVPKPAYNAYRTMVDAIGDLHFERTLSSAELGTPNAEGYAFTDLDGSRRVHVIWTTDSQDTGTLRVAAPSVVVSDKVSSQLPMSPTLPYFEPYTVLDGDDGVQDGYAEVNFGDSPIYVETDS
jgi:hypothetical protein